MAALRARAIEIDRNRLYTAEEFMTLTLDPDKRYQLVRGVIEEMSHPGGAHMHITSKLSRALWRWIFNKASTEDEPGEVLTPGGFKLDIDPDKDTIRSPDLTYIRANNISRLNKGAVDFPPDLAVEIYSPNDRPGALAEKLEDYRAAGWNLVWVIYPDSAPQYKHQTVEVYHLQQSSQPLQILTLHDQLNGETVLPGFTLPVKELFSV
jgi:Uma2 family endonuclease